VTLASVFYDRTVCDFGDSVCDFGDVFVILVIVLDLCDL
jgi:hypothetical protein